MIPTYDFSGQVVMVSGAGGNLGRAVSAAFLAAGAHLVLLEHAHGALTEASPGLADSPEQLLMEGFDVTDPVQVAAAVQQVQERFGRLDVLVNTVGGYRAGTPLHETPFETWDLMMNLNARSVFTMCRAVIPAMLARQRGKIINIAAGSALKGSANSSAYGAAKTAVARLTESMAAEYKQSGLNINAILPSALDTPQNRAAMPKADFNAWVTPAAMAQVILFLASPAADPINGVLLPVTGRS